MRPDKWQVYVDGISEAEPAPGHDSYVTVNPQDIARHEAFIDLFRYRCPPPARVLAPGAVSEALMLAQAGYEVHAQVLGRDAQWLCEHNSERLVVYEGDAHDLDFPPDHFDGYFTVQTHEHWLAPMVHLGEVRSCMKVGAIAFVDACGTTNPDMRTICHTNLVPAQQVEEQWAYWGWETLWHGSEGDDRPQFVFRMMSFDDPRFKHREQLRRVMQRRAELL